METPPAPLGLTESLSDQQLLALAAHPPKPLWPLAREGKALWPLVVLTAVLPPLWAAVHAPLDESAARYGIHCLQLWQGTVPADDPLRFQPPLAAWINAAVMTFARDWGFSGLFWIPFLGTVLLIGMTYLTARQAGGTSLGLLAAWLVAADPRILRLAQDASPGAVGLALVLFTLWALNQHRTQARSTVSWWLLAAGIGLGFCLLAVGPAAGVVWLVVALGTACGSCTSDAARPDADAPPHPRGATYWTRLAAPGVMLLTAFAVGGWWVLMTASHHGGAFWQDWLAGLPLGLDAAASPVDGRPTLWFPVLLGLIVLGVWDVVGRAWQSPDPGVKAISWTWLIFGAVGMACAWLAAQPGWETPHMQPFWNGCAALAFDILAAHGLLTLITRRCSLLAWLVAVWMTFLLCLLALFPPRSLLAWSEEIALLLAAGVLLWQMFRVYSTREIRQRWLLRGTLLACLAIHVLYGFVALGAWPAENRPLTELRRRLLQQPAAGRVTLVSATPMPAVLRFVAWSVWPQAEYREVRSWTDAVVVPSTSPAATSAVDVWITWGGSETLRPAGMVDTAPLTPCGPPSLFRRRELNAFASSGNASSGL